MPAPSLEDAIFNLNQFFMTATHYGSDAQDVDAASIRMVLDELAHNKENLAFIKRCCRVVYYPPDGSYPIEHAPGAGKDQFDEILRRQEPAMVPGGNGAV